MAIPDKTMIALMVTFLALVVLWVCGTLPWVLINFTLCIPNQSIACSDPAVYSRRAQQILALDLVLCVIAGLAIAQIRKIQRRMKQVS